MIWRAVAALVFLSTTHAFAATCADIDFEGQSFTTCTVDARTEDLRLFHASADGAILGSFPAVAAAHAPQSLVFAMNAGMYHPDRAPVGLYIENRVTTRNVVTSAGPGNFGLTPNGLLCITDTAAQVIETGAYVKANPDCRDATQSGPMLVIDGALHPRFLPDSTSRYIRNGVGTSADGALAVFVISNSPVTFHRFARLFRDVLRLPNALYFDGKVSRLFAPDLRRDDPGFQMGPIVGVLE